MECICGDALASRNPLIQNISADCYAALAAFFKAQILQYPPLDRAANGEDGLDAFGYAVDMFLAYSEAARTARRLQ